MWKLTQSNLGPVIVNDNDRYVGQAVLKYGEFSDSEAEIFKLIIQPGMFVADVGANVGMHTLLFSKLVGPTGRVYAFEPQRQEFNALCGSLALNQITNVIPVNTAVGNGEVVNYMELDHERFNNFGGFSFELFKEGEGDKITTMKIDMPCNFMKIDVEGFELNVLKGAEAMIREYQPVLYVEADRKENNEEMFAFIRDMGYEVYWHLAPFYNPNNFLQNPVNDFEGICSINVLCVPKEVDLNGRFIVAYAEDFDKYVTIGE